MTAQASSKGKMTAYFKGVKAEMKKVNWPNRKTLLNYTGVVIMISALIAFIVWVLDLVLHYGLSFIIK